MNKFVRFSIYVSIVALCGYILAPALSIDVGKIGGPLQGLIRGWSNFALAGATVALAMAITYLITSGWGLLILGALAFCGLCVLAIVHPYLFPLIIPLSALWVACALARRKENLHAHEEAEVSH